MRRLIFAIALVCLAGQLPAQGDSSRAGGPGGPGGRAELPLRPERNVRFTTTEGTWMSIDVSPDGQTLAFDLDGDLYTLPIAGGKATRITNGMAFDVQPRWSPDGKQIVFVSDRDGSDDVWVVDADGSHPKQITRTDRTQFLSPEWTPDGNYILVSKNYALYTTTYGLFMYHKDGGTGIRMAGTPPAAPNPDAAGPQAPAAPSRNYVAPAFGKDSRYVYVSSRMGGAGGYNQTQFDWQVMAYDRQTGETTLRAAQQGGAFKPVLSPDGKWMVYATREDSVTSLRIRDMDSGDEHVLVHNVQRDDMESRFTRDLMPNMTFTPDSKSFIAAWNGKIQRVDIATEKVAEIPFSADIDLQLGALSKFDYPINDSTLTVAQIRGARPSPDGKRLVFTALDKLWLMDLPNGTPRRLTRTPHATGEHSPVWSPDGRYITYITWTETGGDIYRVLAPTGAGAAGNAERLTRQSAYYTNATYTPNGQRIVMIRSPRQPRLDEETTYGREIVWIPAAGGAVTSITPLGGGGFGGGGGSPHFTRDDNDRVYIAQGNQLVSVRFDGTDRKTHIRITGNPDYRTQGQTSAPDQILISPDGERALAEVDNNIYVVPLVQVGAQAPSVSVANPANASVPIRRLTRIGGDFSGWQDANHIYYSIGRSYFSYDLARADSLVRDSTTRADSLRRVPGAQRDTTIRPSYEPTRLDVTITMQKDRPKGTALLKNARVITMKGGGTAADNVIEHGDVLVRDNKIVAVGATGTLQAPVDARVFDMTGKTVMPGFVDAHAHLRPEFGIHRAQTWEYMANLAYGVTATRDPQTATTDVLSYGDLVETGDILGPRIFHTGPGIFWSDDIKSLNDARDVLRRYSDFYNTNTVKQYMVGDRKVRQWFVMATRELHLSPTLEGGLDFKKNLTEAIDGYAGSEHSYAIAPLFKDNVQLVALSGITYTPTLIVLYGGPWAENYWYERYDIMADAKLARFTPHSELAQRGLRRPGWWHPSQYSHPLIAAQAKKIMDAGGRVGVGGHGQLQGLGYHWEMWNLASGGATPMDVLRSATIVSADAIGHAKDIGSLEAGKLADIVVLDGNPLASIQNTNTVRYVMKNGRMYDGNTLAEVWPREKPMERQWWVAEDAPGSGGKP